ncbi:capsid protein 1 [Galliform chaphamaparvovirus 13]|nr:capsid protein 1 [Galliform chaphamaparvovirus 13]
MGRVPLLPLSSLWLTTFHSQTITFAISKTILMYTLIWTKTLSLTLEVIILDGKSCLTFSGVTTLLPNNLLNSPLIMKLTLYLIGRSHYLTWSPSLLN